MSALPDTSRSPDAERDPIVQAGRDALLSVALVLTCAALALSLPACGGGDAEPEPAPGQTCTKDQVAPPPGKPYAPCEWSVYVH